MTAHRRRATVIVADASRADESGRCDMPTPTGTAAGVAA